MGNYTREEILAMAEEEDVEFIRLQFTDYTLFSLFRSSMLTKKNKRKVRKMKKYIKTFPLTEKEIDQMIEDITGMAEEAQERNENFETVLGKSVHEFCDDLIYSVGGIRAPGGRKLIRGTSIYFQLLGLWGIVGCLINVCFLAGERVHTLWMLAIAISICIWDNHYDEDSRRNGRSDTE